MTGVTLRLEEAEVTDRDEIRVGGRYTRATVKSLCNIGGGQRVMQDS